MYTLQVADAGDNFPGTEYSLQQLNVGEARLKLVSQGASELTLTFYGLDLPQADPFVPYFRSVRLWKDRSFTSGAFGGGTIVFQGRQYNSKTTANPSRPGLTLTFKDAWADMEITVFQQPWFYNPGSGQATAFFTRLVLFQNFFARTGAVDGPLIPGQLMSNGQQIWDIIDFARTFCGIKVQPGTIDTAWPLPMHPVKSVMCATALLQCLEPVPDAVTYFDYTTTPPTLHIRQRPNLPQLTLPYRGWYDLGGAFHPASTRFATGKAHQSSDWSNRPDLQVPAVQIQYQILNTVNGQPVTNFTNDTYPLGASTTQPGALVQAVDLRGFSTTMIYVFITAASFDPTSGDPSFAWWKKKKPEMSSWANIAMVAGSLTVKDQATGATVSLSDFPNELVSGEVMAWMPVSAKWVTISAKFTYNVPHPNIGGLNTQKSSTADPHTVSVRVRVTNAPAGISNYSTQASFQSGQLPVLGLAQFIYNSLLPMQYEGSHTIVERDANGNPTISSIVTPANVLNLVGGAAAWTTAKATIQSVSVDLFRAKTEISVGPPKMLSPGKLMDLLQFLRSRWSWENPAARMQSQQSGVSAQVGGDSQLENTTHYTPASVQDVVSFKTS